MARARRAQGADVEAAQNDGVQAPAAEAVDLPLETATAEALGAAGIPLATRYRSTAEEGAPWYFVPAELGADELVQVMRNPLFHPSMVAPVSADAPPAPPADGEGDSGQQDGQQDGQSEADAVEGAADAAAAEGEAVERLNAALEVVMAGSDNVAEGTGVAGEGEPA